MERHTLARLGSYLTLYMGMVDLMGYRSSWFFMSTILKGGLAHTNEKKNL